MSEKILNMSGDFYLEFDAYQAPANNAGEMVVTNIDCLTFLGCTNLECSTLGC